VGHIAGEKIEAL